MPPPIRYKKPKRLNPVSLGLVVFLGAIAYVLHSLFPVYTLHADAKGELQALLPRLYKANLMPDNVGRPQIKQIEKDAASALRRVGVKDKDLKVQIFRDKKRVAIEARFMTTATFPGLEKTRDFQLTPRAETDAARIEW